MVKDLSANAGNTGDAYLILGWEEPLEEEMATQLVFFPKKISWTEETGRAIQSMGLQSWTQQSD